MSRGVPAEVSIVRADRRAADSARIRAESAVLAADRGNAADVQFCKNKNFL